MSTVPRHHRPNLAAAYERAAAIAATSIREGVSVADTATAHGLLMSTEAKNWGQFIMRMANHMHWQERRRPKQEGKR